MGPGTDRECGGGLVAVRPPDGGAPTARSMTDTYIMQRTQISLTAEERRTLDAEAARTGRPISSLIRAAVDAVYGSEQSADDDLASMRRAFGSWKNRDIDGQAWVEKLRSGSRIQSAEP